MNADYLTVPQAAARLDRTPQCVRSLIARSHLAGAIEPLGAGRGWLIPASAVEKRRRQQRENRLNKGGRPRLPAGKAGKSNGSNELKNLAKSAQSTR